MADRIQVDRVRTVDLLWAFKRRCDAHIADGMPMVHFRLLLNDPTYRSDMLMRAGQFDDPELQAIITQLDSLPADTVLAYPSSPTGLPAGSATTAADSDGERSAAPPWRNVVSALLLVTLGGATIALFGLTGNKEKVVSEQIRGDTTWKSDRSYILTGLTFVEDGTTLTIEPGATILGRPGSALIVPRNATLRARGTDRQPIVFTSAAPQGSRRAGDWGGLVLLGNARLNRGEGHIEGIDPADTRGRFGGDDDSSSCGVLDYVRVEFAGFELMRDVELNGLTLAGCGDSTVVRNVQVHRALDDGIEVFGGTVDLSHIVVTGAQDDGFDWDMGWRGRVQYLVVQLHAGTGDNAFEGDNSAAAPNAQPRSAPHFSNVTLIADRGSQRSHRAMTIRRGSGGYFQNVLVSGFNSEAIDLRGGGIQGLVDSGALRFDGIALHASGPDPLVPLPAERDEQDDDAGFNEADHLLGGGYATVVPDGGLPTQAASVSSPVFTPLRTVPNVAPSNIPQSEFWNEGATFIGAVQPRTETPWFSGWTAFPRN